MYINSTRGNRHYLSKNPENESDTLLFLSDVYTNSTQIIRHCLAKTRIMSQMRRAFLTTCTQIVHEEKKHKQLTIRRVLIIFLCGRTRQAV